MLYLFQFDCFRVFEYGLSWFVAACHVFWPPVDFHDDRLPHTGWGLPSWHPLGRSPAHTKSLACSTTSNIDCTSRKGAPSTCLSHLSLPHTPVVNKSLLNKSLHKEKRIIFESCSNISSEGAHVEAKVPDQVVMHINRAVIKWTQCCLMVLWGYSVWAQHELCLKMSASLRTNDPTQPKSSWLDISGHSNDAKFQRTKSNIHRGWNGLREKLWVSKVEICSLCFECVNWPKTLITITQRTLSHYAPDVLHVFILVLLSTFFRFLNTNWI